MSSKEGDAVIDVKDAMEKLKKRNCCLYLLDFKQDLEISVSEGTLRMKTQFDSEEAIDHVIPFDRDTEYLLCGGL